MAKNNTVLLNEVQLATFKALKRRAFMGKIIGDWVRENFKMNVVGALVRAGAIRPFHYDFKLNEVEVQLKGA